MNKAILLTAAFSFMSAGTILAQNPFFEYASVRYNVNGVRDYVIFYSTSSGLYTEKGKAKDPVYFDQSPALKFIEKLNKEGWDVYDVYNIGTGYETVYQLRKETKDKVDLGKVIKNSVEKSMNKE